MQEDLCKAFYGTYWKSYDDTLKSLGPHRLRGGHEETELANVQAFTERWMEYCMDRIWGVVSEPDSFFTNDVIINLFSTFLAPFGQYHPYSCMPTALIENVGHPPPEWPFIEHAAEKLVTKWTLH